MIPLKEMFAKAGKAKQREGGKKKVIQKSGEKLLELIKNLQKKLRECTVKINIISCVIVACKL